jgi:asparagine N-glycosylation enzyme membrane subunit Stt3
VSELEKIVWTAAFTILGGVLVYVIAQLLSKFLIEPTHELKRVIGEVRFNLNS